MVFCCAKKFSVVPLGFAANDIISLVKKSRLRRSDSKAVIIWLLHFQVVKKVVVGGSEIGVMKSFQISGSGSITVSALDLPAGGYQYSLLIDGRAVDTKQMIITK